MSNDYRTLQRFIELKQGVVDNIQANVQETPTAALSSIKIGNNVYSVEGGGGGGGTVISVSLTMPEAFAVTGSPITTTGTLEVTMADGYAIPAATDITKGNNLVQVAANPATTTGVLTSITIGDTSYAINASSTPTIELQYKQESNITTGVNLLVDNSVVSTLATQNTINNTISSTNLQKLTTAYGVYKSVVLPQPISPSSNFTENEIMIGGHNPMIGETHNYYIKNSGYSITTLISTETSAADQTTLPTSAAVKNYIDNYFNAHIYEGELDA